MQDVLEDDDYDFSERLNDGMQNYYDTFLEKEKIITSAASSLSTLIYGKYSYAAQTLSGILLGMVADDKDVGEKLKGEIEDFSKGAYIKKVDLKRGSLYTISGLHPFTKEIYNAAMAIFETTPEIIQDIKKGDVDAINIAFVFNQIIRAAYVNPISNTIYNDLSKMKYENDKKKKEAKKKEEPPF